MKLKITPSIFTLVAILLVACGKPEEVPEPVGTAQNSRNLLYVASGACYAGGNTTSPGSSTVAAYDATDGRLQRVIVDYNSLSPGDSPVGIQDFDANHILVLIENAWGRRIDLVKKDGSSLTTYLVNTTALSGVARGLVRLPDNSLLVSKSSAIEKFSSGKSRVMQAGAPFISAPAGSCATSTTLISGLTALTNGKILFSHAGASPNNKISMVSASGYAGAPDCLTAQAAPTTAALPTSLLLHSSGKLLAAYGSTTTNSNFIYAYNVDGEANTLSTGTASFSDSSIVNGPSAMAEDRSTRVVYVANGNSAFNTIEKFAFDSQTLALRRVSSQPFIPAQIYTRCISDMKVIAE